MIFPTCRLDSLTNWQTIECTDLQDRLVIESSMKPGKEPLARQGGLTHLKLEVLLIMTPNWANNFWLVCEESSKWECVFLRACRSACKKNDQCTEQSNHIEHPLAGRTRRWRRRTVLSGQEGRLRHLSWSRHSEISTTHAAAYQEPGEGLNQGSLNQGSKSNYDWSPHRHTHTQALTQAHTG